MSAPVLFHLDPIPDRIHVKRRVTYRRLACRSVLNRNPNPHHDFYWSINPYRGCEIGCAYCYARYTHGFLDHDDPIDFEREIYAKLDAPRVLAATAEERDLAGRPVALGTATDPYQPAERRLGITRRLLEVLARYRALELSITTKSDLILRDLNLLSELGPERARCRRLTVNVSLITVDRDLARRLEPGAPTPARRLETVAALRAAGIRAGLFVMPILPRITDAEADLGRLFSGARDAGANFVVASLLHLRGAAPRHLYLEWIADQFPHLLTWYRRAYGRSAYLEDGPLRQEIIARVARMRRRHGFASRVERRSGERGEAAPPDRRRDRRRTRTDLETATQLTLPWASGGLERADG